MDTNQSEYDDAMHQDRQEREQDAAWQVIDAYTRAQALADGTLVDLMMEPLGALVREAGFRQPLAMTAAAYASCVGLTPSAIAAGCDVKGRLWDVLMMCRLAMQAAKAEAHEVCFAVSCVCQGSTPELVALKVVCGAGDDGAPVLTIMLDGED